MEHRVYQARARCSLPERQPVRQDHFTYLRGLGLYPSPQRSDASFAERYEPVHRRQVATFVRSLGVGPIVSANLRLEAID